MTEERWTQALARARVEAALIAYETALDWFQRYPAHEVEQRLFEMIKTKREIVATRRADDGRWP